MLVFVISLIWFSVFGEVTADSYDLEEVCRRHQAADGEITTGIFSSKRRFGLHFDLKPEQTIVAVLGLENFATDDFTGDFLSRNNNKSAVTSPSLTTPTSYEDEKYFDCMFGIKPNTNGNVTLSFKWWGMRTDRNNFIQVLQMPEKFVIHVNEKGHYILTARNYVPIQIRIAVHENIKENYGLVVIASSQDENKSFRATSFFFAYIAPCFIILLVFTSIFIGCFCLVRAFCVQCRPRSETTTTPDGNSNFRMCRRMKDKPPNYDDLFFVGVKHQQPPKYEECTVQTSVV